MKKLILILSLLLSALFVNAQFGVQIDISKSISSPNDVKSFDLDGDGDMDVLSSSALDGKIAWYENFGGGSFSGQQIITDAYGARSVYAADLDGDGDLEVLSATIGDDRIAWHENLGGGTFGGQQIISTSADGANSVYAVDLDGDGDMDVLSASYYDAKIVWYENLGGGTIDTTQQIISTSADGAYAVHATDLDGDGDMDVLSASYSDDKIAWYENLGGGTIDTTQQIISTNADGARSVHATDLDGDGDMDVLSASYSDDKIAWYENLGGGAFSGQQIISTSADGAISVYATDLDGDGDMDVLSGSYSDNKIAWHENLGGGTIDTTQQIISISNYDVRSIYATDLDGDGKTDILFGSGSSISYADHKVAWYVNLGSGTFGPIKTLSTNEKKPYCVYAADLDGDGDLDVLSGTWYDGKVTYYENLGGGSFGGQKIITTSVSGVTSVYAADLDGDGDIDVLSSSWSTGKIAWYENLGGGSFAAQELITSSVDGAQSVYATDIDGDGDLDVLSASFNDDKIAWYENLGGGAFGLQQIISSSVDGARHVFAADLDDDGDKDVLFASSRSDVVGWYENLGGGIFNIQYKYLGYANGAFSVKAADLDGDGDMDVLSASNADDKIVWYENLGAGAFDSQKIISTNADIAESVYATDLDGDGDMDVLSASRGDDKIAWYENLGAGAFGFEQIITTNAKGANTVYAADLDGDGDMDVLSASQDDNKIAWYKNYHNHMNHLSGQVFYDENQNGVLDTNEGGLSLIQTNIAPNGVANYSNSYGNYYHIVDDTNGTYTLSYEINSLWNLTTDSTTFTTTLTPLNPTIDSLDFGFYPDTIITVIEPTLIGTFPRCNTIANYWIDIRNLGTTLPSGLIHLQLDDSIVFVNADILPDSTNGQNFYWHYDSLFFQASEMVKLEVQMPPFTSLGDTLTSILTVHELGGSNNIVYSNSNLLKQVTLCAYDPNDKNVSPKGIGSEGFIANNQELEYLIRFQNTGNDTAITVMIRDQLDSDLDWSTLQPIAYSHAVQIQIEQDGEAIFTFNNILLPDSNVDFLGSQGFIKFKIQPKVGLLANTTIHNTSHIYFDGNPAVITNTVLNTIYDCTGFVQNSISNLNVCQNDTISGVASDDLSTTVFNWSIPNVYNSTGANINWAADTSGVFNLTLSTINSACNKDTTIVLNINSVFISNQNNVICQGDSLLLYETYQNTTGTYYDSLQTINGCDSILSTTLTVIPIYLSNQNDTICQGDSLLIYGAYQSSAGVYYDSLQTMAGCDSILITNLLITPTFIFNQNDSICQGDSLLIYGLHQNTMGVYYDSLQTINGCDSILSTTLTINSVFSSNQNDAICQGDSIFLYSIYQNTAGVYYDSLQTINGCDSILSTTLTINPVFSSNQNNAICQGDSLLIYGTYQNTASIYYDSLLTLNGCDSILSTTLTIGALFSSNQNDTICQGDSILLYGVYQNTGGIYYDSLQTINGCDSVLSTTLSVNPVFSTNQNDVICQGDSILLYGNYQNSSGIYYDSLQMINGCDSIFSTTLTVNSLPSVSLASFNPDTICTTANAVALPTGFPSGGNYTGNGVGGGNFTPSTAGVGTHDIIYTYTDGNSCINSDTTIVTVDICTGIDNINTDFGIIIYPNPSTGQFTIEKPSDLNKEIQVKLLDASSKLIISKTIPIGQRKVEMDIRNYSKGIYYLQLIIDDEIFVKQILKN
jgi:uncharacterized repeat protein (TIGR01451 family)